MDDSKDQRTAGVASEGTQDPGPKEEPKPSTIIMENLKEEEADGFKDQVTAAIASEGTQHPRQEEEPKPITIITEKEEEADDSKDQGTAGVASENTQRLEPEEDPNPSTVIKEQKDKKTTKQKTPKQKKKKNKGQKLTAMTPPNIHVERAKQLNWFLPRMTSPMLLAPVPIPDGLASSQSQSLIIDANIGIWTSMEGFHFEKLPFLDHDEMVHLACCIELLPVPAMGIDNLFFWILCFFRHMNNRTLGSFSNDNPGKREWYASVRQEVYNSFLTRGRGRSAGHRVEPYRQSALGLAALKIPVIVKVIEACAQARRNFNQLHPAPVRPFQLEIIDEKGASIITGEGSPFPSVSQLLGIDVSQEESKQGGGFDGENETEVGVEKAENLVGNELEDEVEMMDMDKFDDDDNVLGKEETESEESEKLVIKQEDEDEVMDGMEDYDKVMTKNEYVSGGLEDCKEDSEVIVKAEDEAHTVVPTIPLKHQAGTASGRYLKKLRMHVDTYLDFYERMENEAKALEWTRVFGSKVDGSSEAPLRLKEEE
ncbi:hypothetical protein CONLIGDRAFT_678377 [Coniochaeta ligniaria NRRL 30616]|uniref:Uncharacterized protein n=1 Tax=Coniochaeta ligniaria NRRL 30616 TaxID=1408157 RepID=A0A1J7JRE3_9PEZI|nr:hypothetical protein CONLIGDRAFT_678377 [Coniochaeta ligniaria NRRL 30616]